MSSTTSSARSTIPSPQYDHNTEEPPQHDPSPQHDHNTKKSPQQEQRIRNISQQRIAAANAPSLTTAPSMRATHNSDADSRHLIGDTSQQHFTTPNASPLAAEANMRFPRTSNVDSKRSSDSGSSFGDFPDIPMIESEDASSTRTSSKSLSLCTTQYKCLPRPGVEHPTSFSSSDQVPAFRVCFIGHAESDKDYDKRTSQEYKLSSVRVPLGANACLHQPVRYLLSTHPQSFKSIQDLSYKWNQELLQAAATQLREELPCTRDPDSTVPPSTEPPGFMLREGKQNSAIAQARGRRDCQEDVCKDGYFEFQDKTVPYTALFDGHGASQHGGSHASAFCAQKMAHFVLRRLLIETSDSDPSHALPLIRDALCLAFVDLSRSYKHHDNDTKPGVGGSTANAAFMIEGRLWVANVGDSRAMLVNCLSGKQVALSVDARPNNPRFKKEAEERGGTVSTDGTRIGTSAVARAIGDHNILGVSARADVCFFDRPPEGWTGWYLVQTCDGIHEEQVHSRFSRTVAISSQEMGNRVYAGIRAGKSLPEIAKNIVEVAYRRGSGDNLSLIITPLDKM